ncbi:YciI family protein [Niabella insulamsoli]|uniref:YciI family protein n=1 Tax=Niabella insulamsoli TaxID=3144874 RepID=UPI0031FD4CC5
MSFRVLFIALLFAPLGLMAQEKAAYDKELADSLGADAYGMRMYQFVILKTGPTTLHNKDSVGNIFKGHMDNITRLVKEGKLIVAGPFGKNDKSYRGLFIFTGTDRQQTVDLLATDPAVKTGLLAYDIFDWYGAAALPMYLPFNERVTKTSF